MIAERLNLRLFVDGVELPVVGASVVVGKNQPASATVKMVASDAVYDIHPRAFVTLFVWDSFDYVEDPSTGEAQGIKIGPQDLRRWKLLFAGEMIGIAFQKGTSVRHAVMSCVDCTNYFDQIQHHYINFSNGGIELFESAFLGIKQNRQKFFDVVTADATSQVYIWLTQSKNAAGKASLYLGLHRILREMFFAVNEFYAEAFNRLRIGDQIVGLPEDETAAKLFSLEFFKKFITSRLGGQGGAVPLRALVQSLMEPVFHSLVSVPCPRFDRTGRARGLGSTQNPAKDKTLLDGIIGRQGSWPDSALHTTLLVPDTTFLCAPLCNVVFPHQYISMSYSRDYASEPTRLFFRTNLFFQGGNDAWMTERFYAPDFEIFNDQLYKSGGYLDRLSTTLLPHEKYVGIRPQMMYQPDVSAYVQQGARRDYFAKMADFTFWKMKFSQRTVSSQGPLNLNLVPGFPGVIIDAVATPGATTRHYVGEIAMVSHNIDQNGGYTDFSMINAYLHNEDIDFDGRGRPLEELTSRATDGFLDDRYDPLRIGTEVYSVLLGCDSLVSALDTTERGEGESSSITVRGVENLHQLYSRVVTSGGDVNAFTSRLTNRPKANLPEMLGTSVEGLDSQSLGILASTDPAFTANPQGFFASAVDPEAPVTQNATYKTAEGKEGRYQLQEHLEDRRTRVKAYADSLRLRGMRG